MKCKQTDIRVGNEVKVTLLDTSVINTPPSVPNSFTFSRGAEVMQTVNTGCSLLKI